MILVDTSIWIPAFRKNGDERIRRRVHELLETGDAAWCPIVRLELWAGVGNDFERKTLREFEQLIPELEITHEVWQEACDLAAKCRKVGKTFPANDILIAACGKHHGVAVEHADHHIEYLMRL